VETDDLNKYLTEVDSVKIYFAPNTSDEELIGRAKKKLSENGVPEKRIQINYDIQQLGKGDIYVSYEPPDLVVRMVYDKKPSGLLKMRSTAIIRLGE
jgi:hypothetical protein